VIEHGAGAVRAYLGSGAYFSHNFPGQVDMLRAVRSPGSSLKPFIYGFGFDAGLIHPETLIEDRPGPVSGYAPGNFDQRYLGEIRVRQALVQSRNLPAVRLLERLGPEPFVRRLEQTGVRLRLPRTLERPGLPIALGGVGLTPEDLGGLYAALAEGGRFRAPRLWAQASPEPDLALMSPAAAWYLTDILAQVPLPPGFAPGPRRIAFKTGTSYGFRDAWCLGYGARYTAAVWVGRPDGGYTPGLSGLGSAAPVLLEVFDLLSDPGVATLLQHRPPEVLLAGNRELASALQRFGEPSPRGAGPSPAQSGPRIRYPPSGSLVEFEARPEARILVEASGGQPPYYWLLDGRYLSSSPERPRLAWRPRASGPVSLTLIDHRGRSDRVEFELRSLAE
jgi:penicillin-binding protein 1C